MDPEITDTPLMEQAISFLRADGAEQTQTQTKSAGNQMSQENSLLSLHAGLSEIEQISDEGPKTAPEPSVTPPFTFETTTTGEKISLQREVMAHASHSSFCDMPGNSLMPDQHLLFDVPPVQADQIHFETPYPEYPAQPDIESDLFDWQHFLSPASQAALQKSISFPSCEVTEKAKDENLSHGKKVVSKAQREVRKKQTKSVRIPPLPSTSVQPSTPGVGKSTFIEGQEPASFSQNQPQAPYSSHHPHLRSFHLELSVRHRPQAYLHDFQDGCNLPTGSNLHASQTPNIPYLDYIYSSFPHLPSVYGNLKQHAPDMTFNSPPFRGRPGNPNIHENSCNLSENIRLWQKYCIVARTVYSYSPDLEALACFFMQVLRTQVDYSPDPLFPESVWKATQEWWKLSVSERMNYYHMAQNFMESEQEGIRAEQEPWARHDFSVQTSEQSEGNVSVQGANSNVQDLAENTLWEYNDILKELELLERSEVAKETEVVDNELKEGKSTAYLNELCSQTYVTEAGAEIDMTYPSSLRASDSNTAEMLTKLGNVDYAQDVPTAIPAEPVNLHPSYETTTECFSSSPPRLHSPSITDPLIVLQKGWQSALDCTNVNTQKETQIRYKNVREIIALTTDHSTEEQQVCCPVDTAEQITSTETSSRDKIKPCMDKSNPNEVILPTAENQLNDLIQCTEELLIMLGQKGEDAGYGIHINNPQLAKSQSCTRIALLVPQDDTATVEFEPNTLLTLGKVEVEFLQDFDERSALNYPPEVTLSSVEKTTEEKEVMWTGAEVIKEPEEHENMVMKEDSNKSKENEVKTVQFKMSQLTHAGSSVANENVAVETGQIAVERSQDNTRLGAGNGSSKEQIEDADSLSISKDGLGQDQNIEPGQRDHLQAGGEKVSNVSESSTNPKILTRRRKNLGISLDLQGVQIPIDQENSNVLVGKKKKDHRQQNLKKDETEVAQQIKYQRNQVRTLRSSKDVCDEIKNRRINKAKRQPQRISDRVSEQAPKNNDKTKTTFVMDTRMTRREFSSHGTQDARDTDNSNTELERDSKLSAKGKKNSMKEIKSTSNSDMVKGRQKKTVTTFVNEKVLVCSKADGEGVHEFTRSRNATRGKVAASEKQTGVRKDKEGSMTRSKKTIIRTATHLSNEKTRTCRPVADKGVKTKEGELNSNTREGYDSCKSNSLALDFAVTADKLKEMNEEERQGKKVPVHEQSAGDKRLTRSYTASLQLQVKNETRKSEVRNGTRNQKEAKIEEVKKSARDRQEKEARVDLKGRERTGAHQIAKKQKPVTCQAKQRYPRAPNKHDESVVTPHSRQGSRNRSTLKEKKINFSEVKNNKKTQNS